MTSHNLSFVCLFFFFSSLCESIGYFFSVQGISGQCRSIYELMHLYIMQQTKKKDSS